MPACASPVLNCSSSWSSASGSFGRRSGCWRRCPRRRVLPPSRTPAKAPRRCPSSTSRTRAHCETVPPSLPVHLTLLMHNRPPCSPKAGPTGRWTPCGRDSSSGSRIFADASAATTQPRATPSRRALTLCLKGSLVRLCLRLWWLRRRMIYRSSAPSSSSLTMCTPPRLRTHRWFRFLRPRRTRACATAACSEVVEWRDNAEAHCTEGGRHPDADARVLLFSLSSFALIASSTPPPPPPPRLCHCERPSVGGREGGGCG